MKIVHVNCGVKNYVKRGSTVLLQCMSPEKIKKYFLHDHRNRHHHHYHCRQLTTTWLPRPR